MRGVAAGPPPAALALVLLAAFGAWASDDPLGRIPINIGGTFPMEAGAGGWAGGQACLPAVLMALEDLNSEAHQDIIPGYYLNLTHNNSKCQPGLATQQLYDLLYDFPTKLMLLAGCSPVTTVIAEAAPVWNLVVLSYGASSPALSNRERFPTLFRTHPSANMQNPTRIHLFDTFGWKKITILQSVEEVFTSTAKDLEELCKSRKIRAERQSFYGDPTDAVKTLQRQDARIIVGLFYVTEARRVLCQAYHHNMFGKKYVWFFIGWYADNWYIPPEEEKLNCTAAQMKMAAQYHLTTESIMLSRELNASRSGMTGEEFEEKLKARLTTNASETGGFPEAPLAYDAMWALALAFNCAINKQKDGVKIESFTYNNTVMKQDIYDCVRNTSFRGVSGNVQFSEKGDRIARTQIEQFQDDKYVLLGTFDNSHGMYTKIQDVKWHGTKPPTDSTVVLNQQLTVSNSLYFLVCFLVFVGIALCIACFIFNTKYSYRGVIIQSQPACNNIMLAGSALCCSSLLLMGLPSESMGMELSDAMFTLLCHSRLSILMIGFTFAYGAMFAKVWIVHRIGAAESQQIASRQKDEYKPLLGNSSEKEEGTPWENIRTLIATMVGRQAYAGGVLRKSSTPSYGSLLARRTTRLSQPIAAVKFYIVIVAFFAIDVVIILVWTFLDPLQRKIVLFPLTDPPPGIEDDVKYQPVLENCESNHQNVWTSIILGYKLLLLIFGLFLSYEGRNLKLRFVNDSRLVGLAIYNVAILGLITGPIVTLLIRNQADATFGFVSVTVILCIYISVGLVFVPKIRFVMTVPPSRDEQVFPNGNVVVPPLSKADQKRLEQLSRENEALQRQIDEKDERISQCRSRLDEVVRESGSGSAKEELISGASESSPRTPKVAKGPDKAEAAAEESLKWAIDETTSFSTPTTLTTTALIELQPASNNDTTGRYNYEEMDNSSSSDEILL